MRHCILAVLTISGAAWADTSSSLPPGDAVVLTPAFINSLAEPLRDRHPGLLAARARVEAAQAGVAAVRTWEDPRVMLGGMFAEDMMRAEDGDLVYGVEQMLPLFGRPRRERAMARAELGVEQAGLDFAFQTLRRDLAQALFRAALAQRSAEVGAEDLRWLEAMTRTAEERYRVGDLPQIALLRLQNERAVRAAQLATDRQVILDRLGTVNRLLARDINQPWPRLELPPVAEPITYNTRLIDAALANEPRLKKLREEVRRAAAAAEITRAARLPEIELGAEGRNYTGDGDFRQAMLRVSVSLPWVNRGKYRQDARRADAQRQAAEFEVADNELQVREEVRRLTTGLEATRREALLYRDEILPRSAQALEVAQSAWTANRAMLLDVLEARRMLLEAKLMFARAVSEQYQMLTELVLCCGLGDLESLRRFNQGADSPAPTPSVPEPSNSAR